MNRKPYNSVVKLSTDGATQVGPWLICANGLIGGHRRVGSRIKPVPDAERGPVHRYQVEVVKELLAGCRPTRWARDLLSPVSSDLKHWAENWGGPELMAGGHTGYVSTGAAIVAAIELGLVCIPTFKGSRNVIIGVHFGDVAARMAERGWYIAHGHEGATRIQPPKPKPERDPAWWAKYAAENSIDLGQHAEPDPEPSMPDPEPEPPPMFWEEIAEALGLSEAEEC